MASEEILCEYFNFLRNLPSQFIECEKKKLIDTVRKEWKIDDILSNVHGLNFEKTLVDSKNTSSLTDELSISNSGEAFEYCALLSVNASCVTRNCASTTNQSKLWCTP